MLCLRLTLFFALFCIIIGQPVNKEENERIPEHLRVKRFDNFPSSKSKGGRFDTIRRHNKGFGKKGVRKGAFKH